MPSLRLSAGSLRVGRPRGRAQPVLSAWKSPKFGQSLPHLLLRPVLPQCFAQPRAQSSGILSGSLPAPVSASFLSPLAPAEPPGLQQPQHRGGGRRPAAPRPRGGDAGQDPRLHPGAGAALAGRGAPGEPGRALLRGVRLRRGRGRRRREGGGHGALARRRGGRREPLPAGRRAGHRADREQLKGEGTAARGPFSCGVACRAPRRSPRGRRPPAASRRGRSSFAKISSGILEQRRVCVRACVNLEIPSNYCSQLSASARRALG